MSGTNALVCISSAIIARNQHPACRARVRRSQRFGDRGDEVSDEALRALEQSYPPIVTTAQVAEILGLNPRTVMLMAVDGRLPASRIPGSRSYRFFLADVVKMLADNAVAPGDVEPDEVEAADAE